MYSVDIQGNLTPKGDIPQAIRHIFEERTAK
jgi:hypothetical protein